MVNTMELMGIVISLLAFAYAGWLYLWVKKQPQENQEIERISKLIQEGARAFLGRQYKLLFSFAVVVAFVVFVLLPKPIWQGVSIQNVFMALSYAAGT